MPAEIRQHQTGRKNEPGQRKEVVGHDETRRVEQKRTAGRKAKPGQHAGLVVRARVNERRPFPAEPALQLGFSPEVFVQCIDAVLVDVAV